MIYYYVEQETASAVSFFTYMLQFTIFIIPVLIMGILLHNCIKLRKAVVKEEFDLNEQSR